MTDDAEMVPFYIAANAALRGRVAAAEALAGDLAQASAKAEAEIDALRARVEALEREVARLRGVCAHTTALLSDGLEIVESLSAGYDVWAEQTRTALGGCGMSAEAAEQRAEALAAELAQARAEGEAAERAAVVAHYSARAARMRAEGDAASGATARFYAYAEAQDAERVARAVEAGEHVGALVRQ